MKKLGICGDSYMSSMAFNESDLDNGYNKHFTEILAGKLKWDLVTFAKVGCSNQAIRLQIDEIIKESPDYVIIGLTSTDRIELPISYDKNYNIHAGLYNIEYRNCPNVSATNLKFEEIDPVLISMTINDIFTGYKLRFNKDEINHLKFWFQRFFDVKWKEQQDSWIITNGLRKLMDNNIPFFCVNAYFLHDELNFFGKSIIYDEKLNPWSYFDSENKYWFHTTLESQEILADEWYKMFLKNNIKKII